MIVFRTSSAPDLRAFGICLERLRYVHAVSELLRGVAPEFVGRAARDLADAPRPAELDPRSWSVVALLLLGQPQPESDVRGVLCGLVDCLLDVGLLKKEGDLVRCDRYAVVPLECLPFVVSRLRHGRSEPGGIAVYYGLDTVELVNCARVEPGGEILDLGCGGGMVGIIAALNDPTRHVMGTDLCPEAVQVARFNAAMHGASYSVLEGDLYEQLSDRQFDLILADPPSLAIPDDLAFPIYGKGGEGGDNLLRRVVDGAVAHLSPGGRLIIITELQCPPGIPFVEWSKAWVRRGARCDMRIEVRSSRRFPAEYHRHLGDNLRYLPGFETGNFSGDRPGERFERFAQDRKICFGYWVHVTVSATADASSRHEVVWCFRRANPQARPRRRAPMQELEQLFSSITGQSLDEVDGLSQVIEDSTGERTIASMVRRGGSRPWHEASRAEYLAELVTAMSQLELLDF
jgi:precorrin-6B methylase 2